MHKKSEYAILVSLLILTITLTIPTQNVYVAVAANNDDLIQYEWPQVGGPGGYFRRFSEGPAPDGPDILWRVPFPGAGFSVVAAKGMVFATNGTNVIAIDGFTGEVVWNTVVDFPLEFEEAFLYTYATMYVINSKYLIATSSEGNAYLDWTPPRYYRLYCFDIDTGEQLWVSSKAEGEAWLGGPYADETKMLYTLGGTNTSLTNRIDAWNLSDPSKPANLAWRAHSSGGAYMASHYGYGKIFVASGDFREVAFDAVTGELVWSTETKGRMGYWGTTYEGLDLRGALDNTFYAFDADTGKIVWTFKPETHWGYWASGPALAYGKIYELNEDGHLYCLDARTGKLVWKYKGSGNWYAGFPFVADGKVYAQTGQAAYVNPYTGERGKAEFTCLDAETGKVLWQAPIWLGDPWGDPCGPCIAYGNIYDVSTFDGYTTEIIAIGRESKPWSMWRRDATRSAAGSFGPTNLTVKWTFATEGAVVSSPAVVDNKVYFGSYDKKLYCIDSRDGSFIWSFQTGTQIRYSPAVVNGKVYTGLDDGYMYCLNADTGALLWKKPVGEQPYAATHQMAQLASSPAVVDDKVIVGSLNNKIYCFDADSGNILWTRNTGAPVFSSPCVVDGSVYIASADGVLYKLEASDGTLIYQKQIPRIRNTTLDLISSPTVAEGMVFIGFEYGWYGINATTGDVVWTHDLGRFWGMVSASSPTYVDGGIYVPDWFYNTYFDVNGTIIWNTWRSREAFSTASYADGKLYIGCEDHNFYVLDFKTGEKLSWYWKSDAAWPSSPAIYGGNIYVGSSDWNLYCFGDPYPEPAVISTSIVASCSKSQVNKSESVTVTGCVTPALAYAPVNVTFIKPDKTTVDVPVNASADGVFQVSYTLNIVGNWTVMAWWKGDKYHSYAYSSELPINVVGQPASTGAGIPAEYIYAGVGIVVLVIAAIGGYMLMKGRKK